VAADALELFSAPVAGWFRETFGRPTPPQAQGWPAIARGEHALIVSPTGSGKTLTAFLWAIDRLAREPSEVRGVRVLYISPLKALNNDVERNLRRPLQGIGLSDIRVSVRTGDTPSAERQKMSRKPPHI
jgi:ATP-dependent helicase Lhr and Lhr-like helicase